MERTNLEDGLMAQMIEEQAWKNLSANYPWSDAQLDKYKDKLDWDEISSNNGIGWTVAMLDKFKGRLNWKNLSSTRQASLLRPDVVDRFRDRWDWKELSENIKLPIETIRCMADYIDWKNLIERGYCDCIRGSDFFREFQDWIPASSFKDSYLWNQIVDEKEEELRAQIVTG